MNAPLPDLRGSGVIGSVRYFGEKGLVVETIWSALVSGKFPDTRQFTG